MGTTRTPESDADRREQARQTARGPTRVSWTWVTLVVGLVLGIALVDFLVQNTQSTRIEFFSVSGRVPVSVALLAAALAGAAVVVVVAIARMVQLRRGLPGRRRARARRGPLRGRGGDPDRADGPPAETSEPSAAVGDEPDRRYEA